MTVLGGTLELNDVTTIQDGANGVLGLGILVEKSGMTANATNVIKVTGIFNQYNWISDENDTKAIMPTVNGLFEWTEWTNSGSLLRPNWSSSNKEQRFDVSLGEVFGWLFTAGDMIDSLNYYLIPGGEDSNSGVMYLNTGIMYLDLGLGTPLTDADNISIVEGFVNNNNDDFVPFPLFHTKGIGSITLDRVLGGLLLPGKMYYTSNSSLSISNHSIDAKLAIWGYKNTRVTSITSNNLNYGGYYSTGNYASFYNN